MSDMNASVTLRLIDNLTHPARQAGNSIRALIKNIERLNQVSGKASRGNTQMQRLTQHIRQAQRATSHLRQTMSRPVPNGFRSATTGLNNITSAANRASNAVNNLNRHMRGGNGSGPSGKSRRAGLQGSTANGFSHFGRSVGSAFMHVGVYEAVDHGIHAMSETIREGVAQAFDLQHTKAMLAIQGESSGTIADVVARARQMSRDIPQFTTAQNAAAIAELRPAMVGGIREAMHLAPQFQKAVGVLEAVKTQTGHAGLSGVDSHGEALDLARAMELKGVMGDGDKAINSYMDGMIKAVVAFNGQITAGDFHAAIKYGRGAARGWSEDFVTHFLPTIMNDVKSKNGTATGAGNALASFSRTIVDRVMKGSAAQEFYNLGLVDKKKFHGGKHPSIDEGGMIGWQTAVQNPYEYFQNYVLPAMKKQNHGKDPNTDQIISKLGTLFGSRISQMLATIFTVQKKQIEKDAQNVRDAMGIDGLQKLYGMDSTTRMQVLSASLKEMAGAIGELAMPGVMRGMKGIIDWAHHTADAINGSPYMKTLGGHFDSLVAGLFGQKMGRKGMGGKNSYYQAGEYLGNAWNRMNAAIGKTMQFWEDNGVATFVATNSARALGVAFDAVASAVNGVRDAMEGFANSGFFKSMKDTGAAIVKEITDALRGPGDQSYQQAKKAVDAVTPSAPTNAEILKTLNPISGITGPAGGFKLPPMVRQGSSLADILSPSINTMASGMDFGSKFMQPITSAVNGASPVLAQGGQAAGEAFASGLAAGSSQATTEMQTLLATLAAMGAAGVTIPVKLDTSGAESDIKSLMNRSAAGAQKRASAQFSNALHDIG